MTKSQMIDTINEQLIVKGLSLTKSNITIVYETILEVIKKSIVEDKEVSIQGFCTIKVMPQEERYGVNPKTQEKIIIPAKNVVRAKFATEIKASINK